MLKKRPIVPILNIHRWENVFGEMSKELKEVFETKMGYEWSKKEKTLKDLTDDELIQHGVNLCDTKEEIEKNKKTIPEYNYNGARGWWDGFWKAWEDEMKKRGLLK